MNKTIATAPASAAAKALDDFLATVEKPAKGRLAFVVDATGSRQPSWDKASQLMVQMFAAAPAGLQTKFIYFRGNGECRASQWFDSARAMTTAMTEVHCRTGLTQIGKALKHVRNEHADTPIGGLVLIGDAFEENPSEIYAVARGLPPIFAFLEGDDEFAASAFTQLAGITGGAFAKFDSNSAARLSDLLRAVAAYASGGIAALTDQRTEAARLLLTQVKKG
jgi:hypothetical protein